MTEHGGTYGEEEFDLGGSGALPLEADDPRRIGPIPLVAKLGSGGMGRVYLGIAAGRYAAVKQVLPFLAEDQHFLRHFGHELDNLSRLPAEVTAPLLDSDRTARPPWLATAYIPGLTLNEAVVLSGGRLPADAVWLLLREAAAGLTAVHAQDMVHRDLKPSNVMLTLDGLALIDFGVARAADQSRLTKTGMVVGTPAYMAPEQAAASRQLTGATDVFALGSLVAYAAVGRPPFGDGGGLDMLYRVVHDEPDLAALRELDPELAAVAASCLAKDPLVRPTAAELRDLAAGHGPAGPPVWPPAVTERLTKRAAFAAAVPDVPDVRQAPADPEPAAAGGPGEGEALVTTDAGAGPRPGRTRAAPVADAIPVPARPARERRRNRVLLAVLPLVVTAAGTTAAIRYLPYDSSAHDHAGSTPSGSVSAPVRPGSSVPAVPAASDARKPGTTGTTGTPKAQRSAPAPGGRSQRGAGSGASGGTSAASSGSSGSSGSGGTTRSGGSATASGGTSPGGSSGGKATPPSGSSRLSNGGDGQCLTVTPYGDGVTTGGCTSGPAATWTFTSAPNGAIQLRNGQDGECLMANPFNNNAGMGSCGQPATSWFAGSDGTFRSPTTGGCLDLAYGSGVTTATCDTKRASQHWRRK